MVTRTRRGSALAALGLAALLVVGLKVPSGAQEATKPAKSARGGQIAKAGRQQFEVFFYSTGVRVFPQDEAGAAIDASQLVGTATFYHPNSPEPWFARPLRGVAAIPGQASESLDLAIDLSTVPPTGATVGFEVVGLPDPAEPTARFVVPFVLNGVHRVAEVRTVNVGQPIAQIHEYAALSSQAYFYPVGGLWNTKSGFVWVPDRGYYHVVPLQYYPRGFAPVTWQRAHPAPSPSPSAVGSAPRNLSGIHTDYFWHPKFMDDNASHEAWIKAQLRQKYGR